MSTTAQPNPPSRKDEDFPKTNTIPEGWVTDAMMDFYNREVAPAVAASDPLAVPTPAAARKNGHNHPTSSGEKTQVDTDTAEPAQSAAQEHASPFTRRLDPFPSTWGLTGAYL